MKTPNTDKISQTFSTPYIRSTYTHRSDGFALAVAGLDAAMTAGTIWNQEFLGNKSYISDGCEHAQHIASDKCRIPVDARDFSSSDPRADIGYAFGMNQAAKLARRLRKLDKKYITHDIENYILTLEQINEWFQYLKAFKPMIVKGRRPVVKTEAEVLADLSNTGVCAICTNRQKLEAPPTMVMHGYKMSEYNHAGYRVGQCFGVGYKPYELSNEANVAYAPILENYRKAIAQALRQLKSGKITKVDVQKQKYEGGQKINYTVIYTKEANPVEFKEVIDSRIAHTEWQLTTVKADIKINTDMIENWTLQPLKYGTKAAAAK